MTSDDRSTRAVGVPDSRVEDMRAQLNRFFRLGISEVAGISVEVGGAIRTGDSITLTDTQIGIVLKAAATPKFDGGTYVGPKDAIDVSQSRGKIVIDELGTDRILISHIEADHFAIDLIKEGFYDE